MGLGAAFVMPATLSILNAVFPPKERPQAIAAWSAVTGIGVVIGPTSRRSVCSASGQESRSVTTADHSHRAISAGELGRGPTRLKHGTVRVMATKAERRAARERVSAYHESQLAGLLGHVGAEIDRYRAGEIDAYAADETIHHYHRAAAELWKFCFARGGGAHAEFVAGLLDRMTADAETIDWWERAAPRRPQ